MTRKALLQAVRREVLHEAGYKCGNPVCRTIVTLDIHHLDPVAEAGNNEPENLLVLCPNCHTLHHRGVIPVESLRAWKMMLLSINEAFDRRSVDLLLALDVTGRLVVSGEGVLECAALVAAGLVQPGSLHHNMDGRSFTTYSVSLSEKGSAMVRAWKAGNQALAVGAQNPNEVCQP